MFRPLLFKSALSHTTQPFLLSRVSSLSSFGSSSSSSFFKVSQVGRFQPFSSEGEAASPPPNLKEFNATHGLKHIQVEPVDDEIAKVIMKSPPVNSMTKEFMNELTQALTIIEDDYKEVKGLLLTSGLSPHLFSAGLDLKTMYEPTEEDAKEFWRALHSLFHRLYMSPIATAAIISGHAPAGGCFLGLCCDLRVMATGKSVIGLNEVRLGIVPPWWFSILMKETIGTRQAEKHLQLGSLLNGEQALAVGLVDHVVENPEEVGVAELKKFLAVPEPARVHAKLISRQPLDTIVEGGREEDVENFWNYVKTDMVQQSLGFYLKSLKKKMG